MRGRVSELLVPAGLMIALVALFFGVIVPPTLHDIGSESTFTSYDFHSYFLPRFMFGADEVARGRLPLWNDFEYGGLPFLATAQPAALYPPKVLLFALFPTRVAYWSFLILHYLVSGIGFMWFAREQKLERAALFVGTALWVFAVGTLASNYHPNRLPNFCWIPYFFLFAYRLAERARLRDFAGLSTAVALQFLAGYPEVVLDTSILVGVMLLVKPVALGRAGAPAQPTWYAIALVAGAVALGEIIASAQTLPLIETALEARRSSMADLASDAVRNWYKLDRVFWPPALITLMFLALSRRRAWMAASDTLLCIFIVAGGWLILRSIPGFSFVRFPFAWALVAQFPFAWAGAAGTQALLDAAGESKRRRRALSGFTIVGALVALGYTGYRALQIPHQSGVPEVISTMPSAVLGLIGTGLVLAVAVHIWRGRAMPGVMLVAAVALTLSHVVSYPFGYPRAAVDRPAPHGKIATLLGNTLELHGRALSVYDNLYGYNLTDRIPSLFGIEESFLPWRWREIIMKVRFLAIFRYVDWAELVPAHGFLDAMNLEYIAAGMDEARLFLAHGLVPIRRMGADVLYRNPDRMGGAWVNYTVRVLDAEQARTHVLSPNFDPHFEVVLEQAPKAQYATRVEQRATPVSAERRISPTELEFDVDLPRPGVLVVSQSAYPGWHAEVDGRPSEWVKADYLLRGVELGPGKHRVRFTYRSMAFQLGIVLSALGTALLAGIWIFAFWRERAKARS